MTRANRFTEFFWLSAALAVVLTFVHLSAR